MLKLEHPRASDPSCDGAGVTPKKGATLGWLSLLTTVSPYEAHTRITGILQGLHRQEMLLVIRFRIVTRKRSTL